MIFIVRIKNDMNAVEGEAVARQSNRNRECTRMHVNFWERDRLGRRGARLATRSGKRAKDGDVFGGTPNTAVETTALPMERISEYSRLLAFICGSMRNSLIFRIDLTQVVDFHDISGYFSHVLAGSIRGGAPVLESSNSSYASR